MTDNTHGLIFEDLEIIDIETRYVVGFRMRKKKNWKYRYSSVHLVRNPEHEHFGEWVLLPYRKANVYVKTKEEGKILAQTYLKVLRNEIENGLVNWWSGDKIK